MACHRLGTVRVVVVVDAVFSADDAVVPVVVAVLLGDMVVAGKL